LNILLDTTYLLPVIGITIKELNKNLPITLMREGNQISICDISIFELSAKGAKHVNTGKLPPQRVTRGINSIIYNEQLEIISTYETQILLTAFKLKKTLNDFIDCIILSAAINHCNTLVTEDNDIHNLKNSKEFNQLLTSTNPNFKIQTLTETL
jgi:PIN domain nuclease of toxin-antitoxin system